MPLDNIPPKIPFVHWKRSGDGKVRPSYRRVRPDRTEFRRPLPAVDPTSDEFTTAYQEAERDYARQQAQRAIDAPPPGTVAAAIADYRETVEYLSVKASSRRGYDYHLDLFGHEFGHLAMRSVGYTQVVRHRKKWFDEGKANTWNEIRKVMRLVTENFMNHNPFVLPNNPWEKVPRLQVAVSEAERAHRPWPVEVITQVLREATPNFRALLTLYLLTGQRGSDVMQMSDLAADLQQSKGSGIQYDPERRVLKFTQVKTEKPMEMPASEILHTLLTGPDGASLLLTPRGKRWNTVNAQETLRTLLTNLGLPRYTLHGFRSTVATELAHMSFDELVIKLVGGWEDARSIRPYLRGAQQQRIIGPAVAALEERFAPILREAEIGSNKIRYTGVTGKAARASGIEGSARERRRIAREEAARTAPKKGA